MVRRASAAPADALLRVGYFSFDLDLIFRPALSPSYLLSPLLSISILSLPAAGSEGGSYDGGGEFERVGRINLPGSMALQGAISSLGFRRPQVVACLSSDVDLGVVDVSCN